MFQYALGKALSLEKHTDLLICLEDIELTRHSLNQAIINGFELDYVFDIKTEIASLSDLSKVLGDKFPWLRRRLRIRDI